MAWGRLEAPGKDCPGADAPARGPEPPHSKIHRVLVLRPALEDGPGAVLVLGEVGALVKLADERHPAEDRLARCCVAAPPCVELVVVLAHSGHKFLAGASGCLGFHHSELTELKAVST